eukprot:gnl/TRDRNA2_/TRDRNA2_173389_c0_seq2.p1 gnl/TRDRNA2_/TRDRNA2_173389_c0~~gnl/TRDRNA2_/TRDRNA2_173389_c0_seq2.p1  ORF type:complete len:401 (-),score=9.37 gnl/TRDRNA2_/TRDRNA2_173389_c0_seq2:187-1344(-)
MLSAVVQFDASLRRSWPSLHRLTGRIYVAAGLVCVVSLNVLRSTTGAGSDPEHRADRAMVLFVDATSGMWVVVTAVALYFVIVKRDYDAHRKWMTASMGILCVPIPQRYVSFMVVTPLAMAVRCCVAVAQWGESPWQAHWGRPGSPRSLLLHAMANGTDADPRASPLVFSLDGYGEGEQASFAWSAWIGLAVILRSLWLIYRIDNKLDDSLKNVRSCNVFRFVANNPSFWWVRCIASSRRTGGNLIALLVGSGLVAAHLGVVALVSLLVWYGLGFPVMAYTALVVGASGAFLTIPIYVFYTMTTLGYSYAVAGVACALCFGIGMTIGVPMIECAVQFTSQGNPLNDFIDSLAVYDIEVSDALSSDGEQDILVGPMELNRILGDDH